MRASGARGALGRAVMPRSELPGSGRGDGLRSEPSGDQQSRRNQRPRDVEPARAGCARVHALREHHHVLRAGGVLVVAARPVAVGVRGTGRRGRARYAKFRVTRMRMRVQVGIRIAVRRNRRLDVRWLRMPMAMRPVFVVPFAHRGFRCMHFVGLGRRRRSARAGHRRILSRERGHDSRRCRIPVRVHRVPGAVATHRERERDDAQQGRCDHEPAGDAGTHALRLRKADGADGVIACGPWKRSRSDRVAGT